MDGDLIQGTLQSLLQNRQQLAGQQQQAQEQHLDTMRTPLPQTSPIQAMVSDYLTKYAANPTMSWSAAASAAGAWPERQRQNLTSQLARIEAADAQAAKYAGENLKEADLFGSKLTAATKKSGEIDKLSLQQQVALRTAVNAAAESIRKNNPNLPAPEALAQALEQVSATTGFDKGDIIGKLYGSGSGSTAQTSTSQLKLPTFEPLPEIPGLPAPNVQSGLQQKPSDYVGNKPSTPQGFPSVDAKTQGARDADRLSIIQSEYAREKEIADRYNNDTSNPEVTRALQSMAQLKKEMAAMTTGGVPQATQTVQPKQQAKPAGTTNQTALEQGYTADFLNKSKESPFAVGLPVQPILTRQLPATELKQLNDQREAYLKSPEIKSLEEQSSGAKELRKYVEAAIDNPAKTGALSPLIQTFNSYAKAAGITLSPDAEDQLREYAKLNQTEKAIGLMGQLMQRGVQTDKDFVRIIQSSFDTSLSPEQRRAVMRQYMDNLNKTINKQQFFNDYVAHPFSKGQERNWESSYSELINSGMPESVIMPNKKVMPYREAAEIFWNREEGKAFKPSKNDAPEETKRKTQMTIKALNAYNARMRDKLKTGAE